MLLDGDSTSHGDNNIYAVPYDMVNLIPDGHLGSIVAIIEVM
jgi:hypothetical protein